MTADEWELARLLKRAHAMLDDRDRFVTAAVTMGRFATGQDAERYWFALQDGVAA